VIEDLPIGLTETCNPAGRLMCHGQVTNLLEQGLLAYCAFSYTPPYLVSLNSTRHDSQYRVAPTICRNVRAKGAYKVSEHRTTENQCNFLYPPRLVLMRSQGVHLLALV
jgi:hypothetical protein